MKFQGIIPPVITPFAQNGSINRIALRKVIDYLIGNGVSGVFVAGSQGEFFSMTNEEREELYSIAVEETAGRVPVFAGTGSVTTSEAVRLTKAAQKAGCAAVSVIAPYFINPNGNELYDHYASIAKSVDIPVLLYNNPDRVGYTLPLTTVERLAKIDNIIGIKDSAGDLTYVNELIRRLGSDFNIFCGKDTVIFNVLTSGGSGAVPASANVAPKLIVNLYNAVKAGDLEKAKVYQYKLTPLRNAFALGSFPVVIKEALDMMGFGVGPARLPIKPISEENRTKLKEVLIGLELI
jgi:4-hydroxy-tetrahydrodipicolinate synthase